VGSRGPVSSCAAGVEEEKDAIDIVVVRLSCGLVVGSVWSNGDGLVRDVVKRRLCGCDGCRRVSKASFD
jgi:hypothetical protein